MVGGHYKGLVDGTCVRRGTTTHLTYDKMDKGTHDRMIRWATSKQ